MGVGLIHSSFHFQQFLHSFQMGPKYENLEFLESIQNRHLEKTLEAFVIR